MTATRVIFILKRKLGPLGSPQKTFGFANSYIRARERSRDRGKNTIELSPNQNKRYGLCKNICAFYRSRSRSRSRIRLRGRSRG